MRLRLGFQIGIIIKGIEPPVKLYFICLIKLIRQLIHIQLTDTVTTILRQPTLHVKQSDVPDSGLAETIGETLHFRRNDGLSPNTSANDNM